jgi:hypothetical protein
LAGDSEAELLRLVEATPPLQAAISALDDTEDRGEPVEAEKAALLAQQRDLWSRIAHTPARSAAGLVAKLGTVAFAYSYDIAAWDDGTADDVLQSMAVDFNALKVAAA